MGSPMDAGISKSDDKDNTFFSNFQIFAYHFVNKMRFSFIFVAYIRFFSYLCAQIEFE